MRNMFSESSSTLQLAQLFISIAEVSYCYCDCCLRACSYPGALQSDVGPDLRLAVPAFRFKACISTSVSTAHVEHFSE